MKKIKIYLYAKTSREPFPIKCCDFIELPRCGHTALQCCPMEPSLSWAFLTGRQQWQRQRERVDRWVQKIQSTWKLAKRKKISLMHKKSVWNDKSWYIQLQRKYRANHKPGWHMGNVFQNYKTWTVQMLTIQLKFVSFKEIDLQVKKELKYMLSIWHFSYTCNTREQIYFLFYSNKALMNWRKNSYSCQDYL